MTLKDFPTLNLNFKTMLLKEVVQVILTKEPESCSYRNLMSLEEVHHYIPLVFTGFSFKNLVLEINGEVDENSLLLLSTFVYWMGFLKYL